MATGTNLGEAYVTIMPSAKGISGSISNVLNKESTSAGKLAGGNIVKAITGVIAGVGAVAGIGAAFKQALDAGGAMQQSFGGLETIYGDAAEGMKKLSYEAAKAGISANDYAEQAVSFGASLRQAFGSDLEGAAQAANMAILDMADNAAKMGTDVGMIQNAYQGFAKQNYTMLDNLKLGYGGTKKEMERLLADAQALTGVEYNMDNLGDVYAAIHAIQQELGIAGVAAAEAEGTFTGSAGSMKAAWENLKADMALGNDITEDFQIVVESARNFLVNNLLPMVVNVLKSIPSLIGTALTDAFNNLPGLVDSAIGIIQGLTDGLKNNSGEFFDGISALFEAGWTALMETDWIGLGSSILDLIWTGITTLAPKLWEGIKTIAGKIAEWFKSIDWAEVGHSIIRFIGEGIAGVANTLITAVQNLGQNASETFKDVDWAEAGKNAFHSVADGIKNAGEFIWDVITELIDTIRDNILHPNIDWGQVGQSVIEGISNGIVAVGNFIYEGITTIATSASEFFRNIDWEQAGKDAINAIVNGIKNIATTLWEAITTIGKTAGEKLGELDWKQLGIDILTAIKDGIVSIGSFLWGALQELGSMAINAILNLEWVQSGIDVVTGIIDGIKEWGSKIGETIVGFAKDALQGIKDFFKIGSPSKVMRDEVGKWIPIGIAQGIMQEEDVVTDAMDSIARKASGVNITPTVNTSGLLASEAGVGGVVMNVTVNGAENPEDWANRFGRELLMELRMA